jgi:hypothetical protein
MNVFSFIKNKIKSILNDYGYYQVDDLVTGCHCGLCGKWISDQIVPKYWRWGICKEHK